MSARSASASLTDLHTLLQRFATRSRTLEPGTAILLCDELADQLEQEALRSTTTHRRNVLLGAVKGFDGMSFPAAKAMTKSLVNVRSAGASAGDAMITLAKKSTAFGEITILESRVRGSHIYCQGDWLQSEADRNGVSLAAYVHAIFGLLAQTPAPRDADDRMRRWNARHDARQGAGRS